MQMKLSSPQFLFLTLIHIYGFAQTRAVIKPIADDQWEKIPDGQWIGDAKTKTTFDLAGGVATLALPGETVEGHWVRLSGRASAKTPDFNVWFHVFDKHDRPLYRPVPTICTVDGSTKICTNFAFIAKGGAKNRAAFYSYSGEGIVEPGPVEVARMALARPDAVKRYTALTQQIKTNYYRSHEVEWDAAIAAGELALKAPADVDPVPQAIAILVAKLPGNSHSKIYSTATTGPVQKGHQPPFVLPTCRLLRRGIWKIDIPQTTNDDQGDAQYLSAAHQCMKQKGVRHWIVNMTENAGGDTALQFGALAPLFGQGPQMMFANADKSQFAVALRKSSVEVGGKTRMAWKRPVPDFQGKATFVVGPGCASACESLAIAAKGRFPIVGQKTAGLTTANESLVINPDLALQLTVGTMTSTAGVFYKSIEPDTTLDDTSIQKVLSRGNF